MQSDYLLLVLTGIAGVLLLLVIELLPGVRLWRKPLTATLLSLMTLLWVALPSAGRWPLSVWSPSTALGGILLWDLTPPLWGLGLVMALALSGAAWIEAAESRPSLPLSGPITLAALLVAWHALAGGSLLTTLALWAVFDVLWGVAGLLAGNEGERMTFGLFVHGGATLCLWTAFLLLSREGGGTLWWLLWPSTPVIVLLVAAAFLRIGLYPFQVVFPRRLRAGSPLTLVSLLAPLLGFGLLYRLLLLPGGAALPTGVAVMGGVSFLWGGVRALLGRGKAVLLWAGYGLLGGIAAAVTLTGLTSLLPAALAVWLLGLALLLTLHRRDSGAVFWSWPAWMALVLWLGAPPSPLGSLFGAALATGNGGMRLTLLLGWAGSSAALLRWTREPWETSGTATTVTPLFAWQQLGLLVGLALPLGGICWSLGTAAPTFSGSALALWALMLLLTLGLCWAISWLQGRGSASRWGSRVTAGLRAGADLTEILDLQWLHRAMLRGMGRLLSLVRVFFEVVEGSGALLWSLLVLLVILLVAMNR